MVVYKICSKCHKRKKIENFRNKNANKDGKRSDCKNCQNAYQKKYTSNNKKYIQKQQKQYREQNKIKLNTNNRKYYLDNKDKFQKYRKKHKKEIALYMKKYREKNRINIINNTKKWKLLNKEKLRKIRQHKYTNDISYRLTLILRSRLRHALKGKLKQKSTLDLVGCSIEELKFHLQQQFKKGMSWNNYGEWHIDHIKPCASFDLTKTSHQKLCFNYRNLQPLWATDNLKKHTKIL